MKGGTLWLSLAKWSDAVPPGGNFQESFCRTSDLDKMLSESQQVPLQENHLASRGRHNTTLYPEDYR